jgi:catechol 2,3-dioxygenase-like lactoylglutathione lyase family enzyme
MKIALGVVGHFGLAVRDPEATATWWKSLFNLREIFSADDYVGVSNDNVTIVFHTGTPHPGVLGHMSFHVADMRHLRAALKTMRERGVDLEDPGDEIGPEGSGSPHLGFWFHDPDGYRWELSVQNGARET